VTYDEFGGQWDHVRPPGTGTAGVHDLFGPGTRIPAILVGRSLTKSAVDDRVYDTTSIMRTIEKQFRLAPVALRTRGRRRRRLPAAPLPAETRLQAHRTGPKRVC